MASSTVERKRFGGTNVRGGPAQPHLRVDKWWFTPLVYVIVLGAFVVYSAYAILIGRDFQVTAGGRHLLSPFYSPCTANICGHDTTPALGAFFGEVFWLSRIFWMIFPLSFRATCYYYRKAYYRSFFFSPPACAVAEPMSRYNGERKLLVVQNTHRVWWYIAVGFIIALGYDAVVAFDFGGSIGMSFGTLMQVVNVILLALYTFSCHSCRHVLGGRLKHFSKHPLRYRLWTLASKLNAKHGAYAWASLIFVGLTDLYIRLVAAGAFNDPRFF
jgi:hypothetical protein